LKKVKKILNHIFIDGLSGMALGLFATLIVGTILEQIGKYVTMANAEIGAYIVLVASCAKALTGAGIGVGVAVKFKQSPLVTVSAAVCGMVGAFASKMIAGTFLSNGVVTLAGPGEPLGAFVAALVGIEVGRLVSGKTGLDIILTPVTTIAAGSLVGLLVGPPVSSFMTMLGDFVNWGAEQQPFLRLSDLTVPFKGVYVFLPDFFRAVQHDPFPQQHAVQLVYQVCAMECLLILNRAEQFFGMDQRLVVVLLLLYGKYLALAALFQSLDLPAQCLAFMGQGYYLFRTQLCRQLRFQGARRVPIDFRPVLPLLPPQSIVYPLPGSVLLVMHRMIVHDAFPHPVFPPELLLVLSPVPGVLAYQMQYPLLVLVHVFSLPGH